MKRRYSMSCCIITTCKSLSSYSSKGKPHSPPPVQSQCISLHSIYQQLSEHHLPITTGKIVTSSAEVSLYLGNPLWNHVALPCQQMSAATKLAGPFHHPGPDALAHPLGCLEVEGFSLFNLLANSPK